MQLPSPTRDEASRLTLSRLTPRRMSAPALHGRHAAAWSNWLLLVAAVGVAVPVLVAAVTGNLAIPHNDAWSYSRVASVFARTGEIKLFNWGEMSLVGQVVIVWPFGTSLVGQQLTVAALGLVCLYCVYDLVASSLESRWAIFAVLMLTLWPGWASLATSFMTDIPSATAAFATLAIGRRALEQDSRRLLVLSLVVAFWGLTIREQTVAAPATVILYALLTGRRRRRLGIGAIVTGAGALAVAGALFIRWRSSLAGANNPALSFAPGPLLHNLEIWIPLCWFTIAAALAPAVFLRARPQNWRWPSWILAAVVAAIAAHSWLKHLGFTTSNYLQPTGEYSQVESVGQNVLGSLAWHVILWMAVVSGVVMAGTIAERWRRVDPVLGWFTVIAAIGTLATVNTQPIFDRYLLLIAPGLLAIVLARPQEGPSRRPLPDQTRAWPGRGSAALGTVALAIVMVTSSALAANAFAYDIARWHTAERFQRLGVPADRVDAGLEWAGWHSAAGAVDSLPPYGLEGLFYTRPPCVVVLPQPIPGAGWTPAGSFPYRTYLLLGHSALYAYYTHAAGCRRPGSQAAGRPWRRGR